MTALWHIADVHVSCLIKTASTQGNCQNPNSTTTHLNLNLTLVRLENDSMSAISQLLLIQFWWNFEGRFLGTSRTDSNCYSDICPGNICPRDICPYHEYLRCNWPDFDETLKIGSWEHLEQIPTVMVKFVQTTFVLATIFYSRIISAVTDPILTKL